MSDWEMNPPEMFPMYPRMKEDADKLGTGLHTYNFMNMKRITLLTDTKLYDMIFSPGEYASTEAGKSIRMDMDRVAHQYFNVHRDVCPHTRAGLDGLRTHALNPKVCGMTSGLNDIVGAGIRAHMDALPDSGEMDLLKVAEFTFSGVNEAIFGKGVVPPDAEQFFYDYDKGVEQATLGLPKSKEYMAAYNRVELMFLEALKRGAHKGPDAARGIVGRLSGLPEGTDLQQMASFLCSIFWAPQANTLPMTFWTLAYVLSNPEWAARVRAEADRSSLGEGGRYEVDPEDDSCLPFTRACMSEVLRMYIANITIRKVERDFELEMSSGTTYRVPKGDSIFLTSYTTHYDEKVFPEPHCFNPDRWLDKEGKFNEKALPANYFVPFGKGRYSCSGRHLLQLELPTLVAMFLRDFDAELIDPVPEPDWSYVVASVRPKGWPHSFKNKIKFSRRRTSKL
jgi:24-hydroxycholesterol 7alpha-hydroxylase